jgi:phosphopantothenoylcysteine decarboxylase/phosphopantothenate--cysteine ligase
LFLPWWDMHTSFAGKKIVIGVSGSISAFKVAGWASTLVQEEAMVDVIMTTAARKFITPLTFEALTGRNVYQDMFSDGNGEPMSHINLGRDSDCIILAPATAQTIARLANGLADDLLSATILAAHVPVVVCPAMNTRMFEHPATQTNIATLKKFGYFVVDPDSGQMACGDSGKGRLPDWDRVCEQVLRTISSNDLSGQQILVTAGPTRETFDPVRFISNPSSGKMGYAIARTAFRRGAEVTLISGPTSLPSPEGVKTISVGSAQEMYDEVMSIYDRFSIIIKSAAVSDFRPLDVHKEKIKKEKSSLVMKLEQTRDILKDLGRKRDRQRQLLVGFAAESSNLEMEGRKKMSDKGLDLIAVNNITSLEAGFAGDNNQLTLICDKKSVTLPFTTKLKTADLLWDFIIENQMMKKSITSENSM